MVIYALQLSDLAGFKAVAREAKIDIDNLGDREDSLRENQKGEVDLFPIWSRSFFIISEQSRILRKIQLVGKPLELVVQRRG